MMRSKVIQQLLRWLIALLGAGLGVAVTLGALQIYGMVQPNQPLPLGVLLMAYIGTAALFGLIFYFLSPKIIALCVEGGTALEKRLDHMSFGQVVSCTSGLIAGLMIAALVSQIFRFMGESMFTTVLAAITYVVLGVTGITVGWKRAGDVTALLERMPGKLSRRHKKGEDEPRLRLKLLDTSVLIDGRILDVCRAGFVEGEVVVPAFVLGELMHIADSADAVKRGRGKRGLDMLDKLRKEGKVPVRMDETDYDDLTGAEVKLLRLAQETEGVIITGDGSLQKAAAVAGVTAWNLNELAAILRPAVMQGEEMQVQIVKEGKEPGQGIGYMPDGTMIVVDGGRKLLGETASVVVANVMQTSAGRMIFAKVK
ncbi:MAG: TRAM domain-containing protein [Clostridia bacterium]|nr:TRAM domain-containing protein [Clostridia bacterium]